MLTTVGPGYWWECRGRNLIQARMPMATSSHGENRTCTAKLRTVRATMAMRTRAMIAGMVIGLHSCRSGGADVSRLAPPVARVDRDQPRFAPEVHPGKHQGRPWPDGVPEPGRRCWPGVVCGALVFVDGPPGTGRRL